MFVSLQSAMADKHVTLKHGLMNSVACMLHSALWRCHMYWFVHRKPAGHVNPRFGCFLFALISELSYWSSLLHVMLEPRLIYYSCGECWICFWLRLQFSAYLFWILLRWRPVAMQMFSACLCLALVLTSLRMPTSAWSIAQRMSIFTAICGNASSLPAHFLDIS